VIALSSAFLLNLFNRISKNFALGIFLLSLFGMTAISGSWLVHIIYGGDVIDVFTAGFIPPYSINLRFGLEESFMVFLSNLIGLLGGLYLIRRFKETKVYAMMLYLMLIMGISGLIMTRDLFNIFVFLEITSIATYSLIALNRNSQSLSAGFKYIIAGAIASSLFLIGTIYIYHLTGTLNIDIMIQTKGMISGQIGFVALFILLSSILIELKPFPANGWALDVYQAADSGIASIIAAANSGAIFFVLYKLLPLFDSRLLQLISVLGIITFIFSNLMGLKQTSAKRLLGYSSIGQMGLLTAVLVLIRNFSDSYSETSSLVIIVCGLFISHFFAKAGLFWLAGIVKQDKIKDWSVLASKPVPVFIFGGFIFALLGFPPFPGFWAKWELIMQLASNNMPVWIWLILFGTMLEAAYLLRWFGYIIKGNENDKNEYVPDIIRFVPIILFLFSLFFTSLIYAKIMDFYYLFPLLPAAVLFLFDWLPAKFKGIISITTLGTFLYFLIPQVSGIHLIFAVIFIIAGIISIIGTMNSKGQRRGFYPFLIMMFIALGKLLVAETTLQFFFAWEIMTISSYLLIIRGKNAQKAALNYILFSTAGAFLILIGFALGFKETGDPLLMSLLMSVKYSPVLFILFTLGFLIKTGSLGFHIWLPGSYSEAEDDVSPILSSILSKAGIFGLIIFTGIFGRQFIGKINIHAILGWIGVLTAFFGALMAVFQEDIKKLLAYSSLGQLGYVVLSIATFSHLGWVTAIYLSFNHLFFKALLFLAVAGIISRVHTRKMYEMGGLIKKMPLSFVSVMMAIIALSGVPPLSGFGGKWLLYTSLIEKGWYLQAGLAFFASTVAFLYCYRLIHTMFLGQGKSKHKDVKEASLWYIVPQYIFIITIMGISMYPNLIIKPITAAVSSYFPVTINWEGYKVISSLGYWNGNIVMMITMIIFFIPLVWLLLRIRSVTKVKQFNIVYAAERPDRPETTHYAHNFFAHYQKAMGFLVRPVITKFWNSVSEWTHSLAGLFRHIYTGNGQTYALHIIIFIVVTYFLLGAK